MKSKPTTSLTIKEVINHLPQTGEVNWIGIRPQRNAPVEIKEEVYVTEAHGLEGDHYSKSGGNRQVTLIQAEHLEAVGKLLGMAAIDPALTRRNIVVSGVNLLAFNNRQFEIGDVILEMTGNCHPCTKMEAHLGPGGYNAMLGHGGITAKVIKGGIIKKGDPVKPKLFYDNKAG